MKTGRRGFIGLMVAALVTAGSRSAPAQWLKARRRLWMKREPVSPVNEEWIKQRAHKFYGDSSDG